MNADARVTGMNPSLLRMDASPHLAAIAFFDQFDRPLTSVEAVRFALGAAPAADALDVPGAVRTDGHWHLPGREAAVEERKRRYLSSQRKFARARRAASLMALVPSVRMVAVSGSLAFANAKEDSDIDLFMVTAPGTIWITRLLVVGALALLRLRPDERSHRDRICMNFFVDETVMDLSGLRHGADDPGFLYLVAAFVPLYDADGMGDDGVAARFFRANAWVRGLLPGWAPERASIRRRVDALRGHAWSTGVLRRLEPLARRLQERLFPAAIREMMNRDSRVVVNDHVLKFHVHDTHIAQRERLRATLSNFTA